MYCLTRSKISWSRGNKTEFLQDGIFKRGRAALGQPFVRFVLENAGQRGLGGCSTIRSRPNGFLNTSEFSLDMNHLLLNCLPKASMSRKALNSK
jgi:hypothetical protein